MKILDITFESMDLNKKVSIREYLKELLKMVWIEEEGFSGKRPFGNSGWKYEIYKALIVAGLVTGAIDSHGYIEKVDGKEADRLIKEAIDYLL